MPLWRGAQLEGEGQGGRVGFLEEVIPGLIKVEG